MARMFEALKSSAAAEPAQVETAAIPCAAEEERPQLHVVSADETPMPFIEVGGRGKPVEGSPDVLSVSPRAPVAPSAPASVAAPTAPAAYEFVGLGTSGCAVATAERGRPALAFTERGPMTVAYREGRVDAAPPAARLAPELIAYHQPEHPVTQQYCELLRQIAPPSGAGGQVLLLISMAPAAGLTTALLNLAICAARLEGRSSAVVDVNWQRPELAARLGLAPAPGLQELLSGSASLEQALRPTAVENLHALTAGVKPAALAPLGNALRWVVGWLRQRYELVLLDGPVWQETAELATLVSAGEEVLLVLAGDEAEQPAVRAASRGIGRVGGRLRGLIVTG